MGDTVPVSVQRLDGRINPEIAVGLILILPALVPVNCRFDARITGPEQIEPFLNPGTLVAGLWKLTSSPFGNHDWLRWIKSRYLLVRPINQGLNVGQLFIFELLAVNTEPEPVDVPSSRI